MTILEALILGIIQGLTEFLPVSSSGHIEIGKAILGVTPSDPLLFSVVVHAATALSTIIIFRDDILMLVRLLFEKEWWNAGRQYILYIIISMVPAVLVGLFYKDEIESLFNNNVLLVGMMLIITALLLFMTTMVKKKRGPIGYFNSAIIGIAQAIAILPGISRSGATIATALLLGVEKTRAARFSFLMVIPVILGAMAKDLMDMDTSVAASETEIMPLVVGFIAAFVTGLAACTWMIQLVKKSRLVYFAVYCFVIGVVAIIIAY
ncbi:MAG: undecaprenyl-diphosphate phosphatase [Flavobacteriales bacterium]|nr:undecaprenyl-diphosphate phosphatase [Flavobacteriales bacterium]